MDLWMSRPVTILAAESVLPKLEVDQSYAHMCTSYGCFNDCRNLDAGDALVVSDAEMLIARTVQRIPTSLLVEDEFTLYIDCRTYPAIAGTAPTYRATSLAGITHAVPFLLSGQGGSETAIAVMLLQQLIPSHYSRALLTAVHIAPPVSLFTSSQKLTTKAVAASTAVVITAYSQPRESGFRLRSAQVIGAVPIDEVSKAIPLMLANGLRIARLQTEELRWAISSVYHEDVIDMLHVVLPKVDWLNWKQPHTTIRYGVADVLVTLSHLCLAGKIPSKSTGLLWMQGSNGALGMLILSSDT